MKKKNAKNCQNGSLGRFEFWPDFHPKIWPDLKKGFLRLGGGVVRHRGVIVFNHRFPQSNYGLFLCFFSLLLLWDGPHVRKLSPSIPDGQRMIGRSASLGVAVWAGCALGLGITLRKGRLQTHQRACRDAAGRGWEAASYLALWSHCRDFEAFGVLSGTGGWVLATTF